MELGESMNKLCKLIYRFILPLISVSFFIGTIPLDSGPRTLFSMGIRVLFCVWLCALYIRISTIENYSIYPGKKWEKAAVGPKEMVFYRVGSVIWGIAIYIMTTWAVKTFLPVLGVHRYWIAMLNSLIVFIPIWKYYWVQKI